MDLTTNKLDLQYMNIYAICLSKLTNEIKISNPPLITQLLSHLRDVNYNFSIHLAIKRNADYHWLTCCFFVILYNVIQL